MSEPWFVDLGDGTPDSTTEVIVELDRALKATEEINRDSVCVVCDKPGIHCHWVEP